MIILRINLAPFLCVELGYIRQKNLMESRHYLIPKTAGCQITPEAPLAACQLCLEGDLIQNERQVKYYIHSYLFCSPSPSRID